MSRSIRHSTVSALSAASLIVVQTAALTSPVQAQSTISSRADYEACQAKSETEFAAAVAGLTQQSLKKEIAGLDYRAVVGQQWREKGLDGILDKQVDVSVEQVRSETSLGNLVKSIADKEKAKELATQVAERVYRSTPVTAAIEGLAAGVGAEVGKRIELASQSAAEPMLACLKAFLGPRYGTTVAGTVAGTAGKEFGLDAGEGGVDITSGAVLKQSSDGITGAALLVMRRQLANMAARVGQRIAGSVLARLVSVVAGGIGLVLIAKDIWQLRKGVLPIIAEEMKSKATKDQVQEELAKSIEAQIGEHIGDIGNTVAERVIEIWKDFQRAHTRVLDLAERNSSFRNFLDTVSPDALGRLDEVASLVLQAEGEQGLLKRLDDGSLEEAVKVMPDAALNIARETRSVDLALSWSSLAGDRIASVGEYELHKRSRPDQFTKASLERLFAIDDRLAIMRLAAIDRDAREVLFELSADELKSLARAQGENQLVSLARYITGLPAGPRNRVLKAVIADASIMQVLSSSSVRSAILSSRDPAAAVDMMLRPESSIDITTLTADFRAAWEGAVSPLLIWQKHPLAIAVLALLLTALLLIVRRIFAPRARATAPPA